MRLNLVMYYGFISLLLNEASISKRTLQNNYEMGYGLNNYKSMDNQKGCPTRLDFNYE